MPRANQFRFKAVQAFLTYPQCDLDKERLLLALQDIDNPSYVLISKETHETGDPHLHAYVRWRVQFSTRDARAFDVEGFHPNIQPARNSYQVCNYVRKHGDVLEWGDPPRISRNTKVTYEDAELCLNKSDFLAMWREKDFKSFVLYNNAITSYADAFYHVDSEYEPPYPESDKVLPTEIAEWKMANLDRPRPERPKSLMISGPTRLGKTVWARSMGKHIYLNTYISVKKMQKESSGDYVIVDDVPLTKFIGFKAIVGCQSEFTLTDKYVKKIDFTDWSKPCIILKNDDMKYDMNDEELEWFLGNCIVVYLRERLY